MRIPGTILGGLALLFGFYQAPFAHIHPDDDPHPASAPLLHFHLHQDLPGAPEISAPTADDAIDIGWNAVKSPSPRVSCDFGVTGIVALPAVVAAAEPIQIPRHRGHDPPDLTRKSPRAPPL